MDDIIAEFLTETNENLAALDNDLVTLEQNPNDDALISKIFRILHTIKGTCGFLGLSRLEKLAHKGEDVLGLFRDKKLQVKPAYVTLILDSFDRIKTIVAGLEATGQEPQGDDTDLISKLEAVYRGEELPSAPSAGAQPLAPPPAEEKEGGPSFTAADVGMTPEELANFVFEPVPAAPETQVAAAPPAEPAKPAAPAEAPRAPAESHGESALSQQTLRVNVDVLENLMTMVSELVLTRNQLLQIVRQYKESDFVAPLQRLNHVVSDLQEGVMKTRMQPIGNAWSKLPRIIRDVSKELGKKIDLEMHGQETELDRQILEMIKDPLTHMVRNSADHGVETPDVRRKAGKPETGKIVLNAYHQGGHINIEITDDGKGLPLEKIKQKAIANGLATAEQIAGMTPQQIQKFIFYAGFSTAEKITAVSGRGVGMDVVRSNIEKIGGEIDMRSEEGKGSTFIIKIPLTLAIVSALIVGVGGERYAIPQLTISELVLVGQEGSSARIEEVSGAPVLRLRGSLLPLISLRDMLGVPEDGQDRPQYVIVTKVGAYQFGMIVDHVQDMEEIVIKPLSQTLKNTQVFSGNTILGDGHVIMIIDPAGVLKAMGVTEIMNNAAKNEADADRSQERENLLLLFRAGNDTLKAAPVEMVSRLEEIDISDIEISGGRPVIQYLGELMPVHNMDLSVSSAGKRPLIILQHEGRNAGLLADQILDITKYYGDVLSEGTAAIADTLIVNEQATDVINARLLTLDGVVIAEGSDAHG